MRKIAAHFSAIRDVNLSTDYPMNVNQPESLEIDENELEGICVRCEEEVGACACPPLGATQKFFMHTILRAKSKLERKKFLKKTIKMSEN